MGAGEMARIKAQPLVDAMLDEIGLSAFRDRELPTLSGGEQQRAHFARVLLQLAFGEANTAPACCCWTSRPRASTCATRSTWSKPASGARKPAPR